VTQQVKQSEGSIGYVELIYALSNRLAYADVKNAGGQFVTPDLKSVTAAAGSATFAPDTDYRVSITNAPGADAYPIASFTWLLIKPGLTDPTKSKQINDFLKWMLDPDAQRIAADLNYAPLPVSLIQMLQQRIGR
jgi:phosphate transport system substrate-binding protein